MKVKCELSIQVVMGGVNPNGTGCKGYLPEGTRYREILRVFGKPQDIGSPDGKTHVEWRGKINDLVFTIYDYKSKAPPEDNTDWHIGGRIKLTAELVNLYFKKML